MQSNNTTEHEKGKKTLTNVKKIGVIFIGMMFFTTTMNAQDKVEASASADIVNKYVWRGQDLGNAAIQPSLGLSYKGLSLSAWGSYGFVNSGEEEIDLTLAYTIGGFNVGITDYFSDPDAKYFYYKDGTSHTFEANVGYDFGPLSFQWYTNFAGFDGVTAKGKRAYTSYFELNAPFKLGSLDWNATVGAIPFSADNGYYEDVCGSGFAVTNISLKASKDIKITDSFSIPVFAAINANPSSQKAYFTFGFTLQP